MLIQDNLIQLFQSINNIPGFLDLNLSEKQIFFRKKLDSNKNSLLHLYKNYTYKSFLIDISSSLAFQLKSPIQSGNLFILFLMNSKRL